VQRKEAVLAYLFGSYAHGKARETSDIDVAVLLGPDVKGEKLYDVYRDLFLSICEALGTERFDLVLLNRAPLSLRFEIVSQGKLIYARDEETLNGFKIDVIRKYQDTAYLRTVQVFKAAIISLDREELFVIFDYIMHTREEQLDEFIEVAKEVGGENMVQSLAERLINEGKEKGIREGIEKGIQKGAIKGKQAALIRLLNKKFGLTKAEERRIESVEDESKIDEALELVLTASEKAEVMRALK